MITGVGFSMKSKSVIEANNGGIKYRGWISTKVRNAIEPRKTISAEKNSGSNFLRTINSQRQIILMRKTERVSNKRTIGNGEESLKRRSHKEAEAPYRSILFHLHNIIFPKLLGILMIDKRGLFFSAIIASIANGVITPQFSPGLVAMKPAYKGMRWLLAISSDSVDCDLSNESIPTAKRIEIASEINNFLEIENRIERMIKPANKRHAMTTDEGRMERPKVCKTKPKIIFFLVNKTAPAMIRQILGTSELIIGDQTDKAIPIKRKVSGEYLLLLGKTADNRRKELRLMSNAARKEGIPILNKGAYNTGSIPPLT